MTGRNASVRAYACQLLPAVVVAACSGMPRVDQLEGFVATSHCEAHACPLAPEVQNLGDGCYAIGGRAYQCTTDALPVAQPACVEIWQCAGLCFQHVTINSQELSTRECRRRFDSDRRARRGPLPCFPARFQVWIGAVEAGPASELPLPASLVSEVIRAGIANQRYEVEVCHSDGGVVIGEATHSTRFAELDEVLRGKAAAVAVPPGQCAMVTVIASDFECEVEKFLL